MNGRRISDEKPWGRRILEPCHHPEHEVPVEIVLRRGLYEHHCPGCNLRITYELPGEYDVV